MEFLRELELKYAAQLADLGMGRRKASSYSCGMALPRLREMAPPRLEGLLFCWLA